MWIFLLIPLWMFAYTTETLSTAPRIEIVRDFLTDEECAHIMRIAEPELKRSTVVDLSQRNQGAVDSSRTSEGMFIMRSDRIVEQVERRLCQLTKLPRENGEAIQVLRYQKGAQYLPHHDYFDEKTVGGKSEADRGGQRLVSVIMYLNTPKKGGETIFPLVNVSVTPKKGSAVLFYNCLPSGAVDPQSLHGGAPVLEGEKWIATKWIRKGTFR